MTPHDRGQAAGPASPAGVTTTLRSALVTGASSGIGEAIALKLGTLGIRVAINARREQRLEEVAKRIRSAGGVALVVPGDVTEKGAPDRIVGQVVEEFGRLDILVNNAGRGGSGGTLDTIDEDLEEQFRLNVWAPFAFVRAAVPVMEKQGGGQIINIGSVVGYVGTTRSVTYTASKWALRGLNESWRDEFYPKKVKVAYVAPGFVVTEFGQRKAGVNEDAKEWAMMPEDVAHYVAAIATQAPNADLKEAVIQVLDRS